MAVIARYSLVCRPNRLRVPKKSEYAPTLSADGKWVAFTSEQRGQSHIYRVHADGSGLEQLTSDPAFDDQGALAPDNSTLAFVWTRDGGFANIWLLDLASKKYRNLTNTACERRQPPLRSRSFDSCRASC